MLADEIAKDEIEPMLTREIVQDEITSRRTRAELQLVFQDIHDQVEALGPALSESQAQAIDALAPSKGYYLSFEIQRKGFGSQIKIEQIINIFRTDADLIKRRKSHVTNQASVLGISKSQLMHYLRMRDLKLLKPEEYDAFHALVGIVEHSKISNMLYQFEEDDRRREFVRQRRDFLNRPQPEASDIEEETIKVELTGVEKALRAIDDLKERERQVFILKAQKVRNIGDTFNVTNERIRQIYSKAKRKLKHGLDQNIFTKSDLDAATDLRKDAANSLIEAALEEQKTLSERRDQEFRQRQEESKAQLEDMLAKYDDFLNYVGDQGQKCLDAQTLLTAMAAAAAPANAEIWATIDRIFKLGYFTFEERRTSTNNEFKLSIVRLQHSLLPRVR